jgi:hypothetical protein
MSSNSPYSLLSIPTGTLALVSAAGKSRPRWTRRYRTASRHAIRRAQRFQNILARKPSGFGPLVVPSLQGTHTLGVHGGTYVSGPCFP